MCVSEKGLKYTYLIVWKFIPLDELGIECVHYINEVQSIGVGEVWPVEAVSKVILINIRSNMSSKSIWRIFTFFHVYLFQIHIIADIDQYLHDISSSDVFNLLIEHCDQTWLNASFDRSIECFIFRIEDIDISIIVFARSKIKCVIIIYYISNDLILYLRKAVLTPAI